MPRISLQRWKASLAEQRGAWIIASATLVLVVIALIWPDNENHPEAPEQHSTTHAVRISAPNDHPIKPPQRTNDVSLQQKKLTTKPPTEKIAQNPPKRQPTEAKVSPPPPQSTASHASLGSNPIPAGYYVQVGAFKDKKRALHLQQQISKAGWHAYLKMKPDGLTAVWVGPEKLRQAAVTMKEKLDSKLKLKGFIIQQK